MSERRFGPRRPSERPIIHREDFDKYWPSPWSLYERPSPFHLGPEIESGLHLHFVTKGERKWSEEFALSEQIYKKELAGLPFHEAFGKYLSIMLRVSDIHLPLEKANKPRSISVLSGIQVALIELLAMEHAEKIPQSYFETLRNQEQLLLETEHPDKWFLPKVRNLIHRVEGWRNIYDWIDLIRKRLGHLKSQLDPQEIQGECSEIAKRISEDRAYGVKNCYFTSPLFLKPNQAFTIFDERLGIPDKIDKYDMPNDTIACIGVGDKPRGKIEVIPIAEEYIHNIKWRGFGTNFTSAIFSVNQSGEISSSVLGAMVPLRYGFERKKALPEYELWRAFMLMRLYDLTKRADVIEKMPSLDKAEREISKGEGGILGIGKKVKRVDYRSLLFPRVKYDATEVVDTNESVEQKRFIDQHHVTWFVRRLPIGYNATERAIEYANEHGVTLREGETIVREHFRGKSREEAIEKPTKASFR